MATGLTLKYQDQFAAYYNMGRQNAFITISHIAKAVGMEEEYFKDTAPYGEEIKYNKESALWDMNPVAALQKKKGITADQKDTIVRQLYSHFPFLKIMAECERAKQKNNIITAEMIYTVLCRVFRVLNYERDKASHSVFVDKRTNNPAYIEEEKEVAKDLNHCFTAAARTIRIRFSLEAKDVEFITKNRYLMVDTDEWQKDKRGNIINDKRGNPKHKQVARINTGFQYTMIDADGRLSDMGRIFLICQFIEKRYASIFFDVLGKAFYGNYSEPQKKIVREIFSVFHTRQPKERLDSERSDTAVAMDMLNELKKCPEELFSYLSRTDQERFRTIAGEGDEEVLLKRYGDRFPQLALQYIDDMKVFSHIRFHVNFGKYRYCLTENKHCVDGESRIRVLQKELNGFGRLGETEKKRTGAASGWNGTTLIRKYEDVTRDDAADFPYVTDSRTQYLFHGDKIGLSFGWKDYNGHISLRNGNYMSGIDPDKKIKFDSKPPVCWLSKYEIPAMFFHIYLHKDRPHATEQIIHECVQRYRRFFGDIKNGTIGKVRCKDIRQPQKDEYSHIENEYGIAWTDIPDKIRDYLVGRTRSSFTFYVKNIVQVMAGRNKRMTERFNENLNTINGKENKIGKRSFVDIRPGRLADFLSKDIVFLLPSANGGKDKPTGLNYRIIQASIAMYDAQQGTQDEEQFRSMFVKAGIIGTKPENQHPFLESVLNKKPRNTLELYCYYLTARQKYLDNLTDYKSAYFLHADRQKWANRDSGYYRQLAARYLEQPVELPRSLFEPAIKAKLLEICRETKDKDLAEFGTELKKERCNVTYMITRYLKFVCDDNVQSFYGYSRGYKVMDLLKGEKVYYPLNAYIGYDFKTGIEKHCETLQLPAGKRWKNGRSVEIMRQATDEEKETENNRLKKYLKEYDDNERSLRRYKVQDILLFFMAKQIIMCSGTDVAAFRLGNIKPDKDEGILELQVPFSITLTLKNNEKKTIRQDAVKIKNYGDFFHFLYDDRIKTLLPQVKEAEIDREILERELMGYDITRPKIFSLVLEYEKAVVEKNPDLRKGYTGFNDILILSENLNEKDLETLRLIRNAFSHNYYPVIDFETEITLPNVAAELEHTFKRTSSKDNCQKKEIF